MPLPSVHIDAPGDAGSNIPDEPFRPKYVFGSRPDARSRALATIEEAKEAATKLTVEQRLEQSSIMAMQLDGLDHPGAHSQADGPKVSTFD